MKYKKGFTLIELLAVIALLSIVLVISAFSVKNASQSAKEKDYESKINLIETAAVFYAQDNIETYPATVTIETLLTEEYLEPDMEQNGGSCTASVGCLINPVTNTSINSIEVLISKTNGKVKALIQN